jgi:hypothetical protein
MKEDAGTVLRAFHDFELARDLGRERMMLEQVATLESISDLFAERLAALRGPCDVINAVAGAIVRPATIVIEVYLAIIHQCGDSLWQLNAGWGLYLNTERDVLPVARSDVANL